MECWECGHERQMHFACETCGAPARKPAATCEECEEKFKRGQNIIWTEREPIRYWHVAERIEALEAALRKIVTGPEGKYDHESGCPFERFACGVAYEALQKSTVSS